MSDYMSDFKCLPEASQGTSEIEVLFIDANATPQELLECATMRIDAALRVARIFSYSAPATIDESCVEASDVSTAVTMLLSDGLEICNCLQRQLKDIAVKPRERSPVTPLQVVSADNDKGDA